MPTNLRRQEIIKTITLSVLTQRKRKGITDYKWNIRSQVLWQIFRFGVLPFRAQQDLYYNSTSTLAAKADVFPAETSDTEKRLGLSV